MLPTLVLSARHALASLAVAACATLACADVLAKPGASLDFAIELLSGRPDTVAGGDALVRIDVPRNVPLHKVALTLNGADITSQFVWSEAARTLTGLVSGMTIGSNMLAAHSNGRGNGRPEATLTLVNHPIQGPVFSGPHEQPYICATASFNLPAGLGNLGAPLDANCSITTRVDYLYRTTANAFAAWPAGSAAYPANLAMTTTTLGKTVPYIIRMETGTINRAIYQTTILHDPL